MVGTSEDDDDKAMHVLGFGLECRCSGQDLPNEHDFRILSRNEPEDVAMSNRRSVGLLAEEFVSQAALVKTSYALLAWRRHAATNNVKDCPLLYGLEDMAVTGICPQEAALMPCIMRLKRSQPNHSDSSEDHGHG